MTSTPESQDSKAMKKGTKLSNSDENLILLGLRAPTLNSRSKKCMFYPNDKIKDIFWDFLISILLLATCFVAPINLAFAEEVEATDWWMNL
jgi:hypothetical protein